MSDETVDVSPLRRAAAELRHRATAATPGPWMVTDPNEGSDFAPFWMVTNDAFHNPGPDEVPWLALELHTGQAEDARYVASLPPVVALALADWLDVVAHDVSRPGFDKGWMRVYDQAFEVARAFLGGVL